MGDSMKIDIKSVEKKSGGMFFKKTLHGVALTVTFSEEERAIIRERRLENDIILERGYSAEVNVEKVANRTLVGKIAKAAIKGVDSFTPDLTVHKLLVGTDTHFFHTPLEAKDYTDELKAKLPDFKVHVMENAAAGEDQSFEL